MLCTTRVDHVLAVLSGCLPDDQQRHRRVSFDHFRNWNTICQAHQARVFAIGSLGAARSLVSLLNRPIGTPAGEVCVAMAKATHLAMLPRGLSLGLNAHFS